MKKITFILNRHVETMNYIVDKYFEPYSHIEYLSQYDYINPTSLILRLPINMYMYKDSIYNILQHYQLGCPYDYSEINKLYDDGSSQQIYVVTFSEFIESYHYNEMIYYLQTDGYYDLWLNIDNYDTCVRVFYSRELQHRFYNDYEYLYSVKKENDMLKKCIMNNFVNSGVKKRRKIANKSINK